MIQGFHRSLLLAFSLLLLSGGWASGAADTGSETLRGRTTPYPSGSLPGRHGQADAAHEIEPTRSHRRAEAIAPVRLSAAERVERLHHARSSVTEADFNALTAYLDRGDSLPGLTVTGRHYLANEIWNVLRAEAKLAPRLARHLAARASADEDPVIRDYALQHLAQMSDPAVSGIQVTALIAAAEPDNASAGTALIGLRTLYQRAPNAVLAERLRERVAHLATDPETNESTRITALSMSGDLGLDAVLPVARTFAVDAQASARLRLAALRLIGTLGEPEDAAVLREHRHTLRAPFLITASREAETRLLQRDRR